MEHARLPYQPALDGIRGLAVAAVLAYHAGLGWARGGFLGVDAFFVLSGFLITSLLVHEHRRSGSINLVSFWQRRARRLLPALLMILAFTGFWAATMADPADVSTLRADAIAALAYVANWRAIFAGDSYVAQFSTPSPLLHVWSLAIEEQWYLFWPPLVALLLAVRRVPRSAITGMALAGAIASAAVMWWLYDPHGDPSRVYYGTDTRAQSLIMGALLAFLLSSRVDRRTNRQSRIALEVVAIAGVVMLATAWSRVDFASPLLYRGGFLALAVAVVAVIAAATHPSRGPVSLMLSFAPLRLLGIISYGVYLWHWPIYLTLTPEVTGLDGHALFALRVAVTLAVAIPSYLLVERPIRSGTLARWRWSWTMAPATGALVLGVVFLGTMRVSPASDAFADIAAASRSVEQPPADEPASLRVLVVGDSVAFTLGQGLDRVGSQRVAVWNQTRIGCGVLRGVRLTAEGLWKDQESVCNDWPLRWQSYVDTFEPDVVMILAGAWDVHDREVDGEVLRFETPEAQEYAMGELEQAIGVLSSRGARVVLLTTPHFVQRDLGLFTEPRFEPERIERMNTLYRKAAARNPSHSEVIDLAAFMEEMRRDGAREGDLTVDGVHFATYGADAVARWLIPQLSAHASRVERSASARPEVTDSPNLPPSRWREMLERIPDNHDTRAGVILNDYARFRAVFGTRAPAPGSGSAASLEYYRSLMFDDDGERTALAPSKMSGLAQHPPVYEELDHQYGFGIGQVELDAWSDSAGFQLLATAPPQTDVGEMLAESDGVFRGDGFLARCASLCPEGLTSIPMLADDRDFALMAEVLDRVGTYTALFSRAVDRYSSNELAKIIAGSDAGPALSETEQKLKEETMLRPFRAYATGAGIDEEGAFSALVLIHDTKVAAQSNVGRLKLRVEEGTSWIAGQPFTDLIQDVEVERQGPVLVAKLRTASPGLWYGLHAAKDTLLLHE